MENESLRTRGSLDILSQTRVGSPKRATPMDSADTDGPVINCIMLVTWPERRQMTQEALVSFMCQDYANRVLTIVNDGAPCRLTSAFHARCRGQVLQVPPGTTIGEKRNAGAQAVAADYLASFDDERAMRGADAALASALICFLPSGPKTPAYRATSRSGAHEASTAQSNCVVRLRHSSWAYG